MGSMPSYLKLNFQEIKLSKSLMINILALIFFVYLKFVFYTNKWMLYNTDVPETPPPITIKSFVEELIFLIFFDCI